MNQIIAKSALWKHFCANIDKLKAAFADAIHSKVFIALVIISFIEMLVLFLIAVTHLDPGSSIRAHWDLIGLFRGLEGSFEQPWQYMITFAVLPFVVLFINIFVALKLLSVRGRQLALCWLWLMVLVGLIVTVLASIFIIRVTTV